MSHTSQTNEGEMLNRHSIELSPQ